MLPDNFDPLFAALGIRKRDWSAPAPAKTVTATRARADAQQAKWNRSKRVGGASQ